MYSILFEIKNGYIPNHKDYNLELFMWAEVLEAIQDSGYLMGITIWHYGDDDWFDETIHSIIFESPQLTNKGINFLEDNVIWENTYNGIANVNEWSELC